MLTQLLTGINLTCFFHCNRAFSYVQLQSLAVTDLFAYALTYNQGQPQVNGVAEENPCK